MTFSPLQYLLLAVLVAVAALIAGLLLQYPILVALIAVGAAIAVDFLELIPDGIDVGINVYIDDIACLVLLVTGIIVILRKGRLPEKSTWPVFALFGLMVINLARGASDFGLKPAGNGARNFAYLTVPSFAWLLLGPVARVDPRRLANWLGVLGCTLTIVALCRWAGVLPMPKMDFEDFRELPRALPAEYAIVIGQSLLAIGYLQTTRGVRWWGICLAGVLASTTFALQHRSVWVSTFLGVTWLAVRTLKVSQRFWLQLAVTAFAGFLVISIFAGPDNIHRVVALAQANFEETQQQDSTWSWRVKGYAEATDRVFSGDALETLLGPPSGRDLGSSADFASVHIHSRYVDTLAYYGVVGAIVLIIWLSSITKRVGRWVRDRREASREMHVGTAFLQALLLSQLTYFVPYSGGMIQGAITALIWLAAGITINPASCKDGLLRPLPRFAHPMSASD